MADVDLLVVEQHAVDGLNGSLRGLGGLIVDEPVPPGAAVLVSGDLAGQNVTEGGEGVVESLEAKT